MRTTITIALLFLIFTACKKEIPTTITGYFYSHNFNNSESAYTLYIDGVAKGTLPFINKTVFDVKENDSVIMHHALKLELLSGEHNLRVMNQNNELVNQSKIYVRYYKNQFKSGSSGSVGGVGAYAFNNHKILYCDLYQ